MPPKKRGSKGGKSAAQKKKQAEAKSRTADLEAAPVEQDSATLEALRAAVTGPSSALKADAKKDGAASEDAAAEGAPRRAAWVDDDEEDLRGPAAARAAAVPSWAEATLITARAEEEGAAAAGKRARTGRDDDVLEGLRSVLARADPVLQRSARQRTLEAPKPQSTLLQRKGAVRDMAWHPSGEVLVTATATTFETVHCSGSFTDRIASHRMGKGKIASFAVCPNGESVVALMQEMHVPVQVNLRTGGVKPLNFMDSRNSTAFKVAARGKRVDEFPSLIAFQPGDERAQRFAMPVGSTVHLGSLSDAQVTQRLAIPSAIEDCVFMGGHQLAVAAGNRVMVYDVRQAGKFVRQFADEGALKVNRLAYHAGVLSVGSTSGTVNTYVGESTTPARTFMNLSASIDLLVAGDGSAGPSMVMGASAQANGFRFVNTATMTVAASFPEVGMRHGHVQCVAFNPVYPIFSVGESQRIVNYAC